MNNISKVLLAADNDRDMLEYLHEAFQSEVNVCDQCGHEEPTSTCDSAADLNAYLGHFTTPPQPIYDEDADRSACRKEWKRRNEHSHFEPIPFPDYWAGWKDCAQSREKSVEVKSD